MQVEDLDKLEPAELIEIIKSQNSCIDSQRDLIDNLEILLGAKEIKAAVVIDEKPKLPTEPVSINGKKYRFIVPAFRYQGERYTAEQAQFDDDLLKRIVSNKYQQLLKEGH